MSDVANFIVTSVNTILDADVSVAPNPVTDNVYVNNKNRRLLQIVIHDVNGNNLHSIKSRSAVIAISVTELTRGLYLFTVTDVDSNKSATVKIMKQ